MRGRNENIMTDTILTTIMSGALFITSSAFAPQAPVHQVAFTQTLPEKSFVLYTVQEGETLRTISKKYYGTEDDWTNIWNDNQSISDPENVEKDRMIKVRASAPEKPAELATVLADRESALEDQKNQEYLKSIGYLAQTEVLSPVAPTIVPTVAPVATTAPAAAGGLSDEAITSLGTCEAGMNPAKNTGNGYYGAFQFSHGTWQSLNTGYERADLAPIEVQKAAVKQLLQRSSIYNQFPACANKMRSQGII
jgi:hypothetical protein